MIYLVAWLGPFLEARHKILRTYIQASRVVLQICCESGTVPHDDNPVGNANPSTAISPLRTSFERDNFPASYCKEKRSVSVFLWKAKYSLDWAKTSRFQCPETLLKRHWRPQMSDSMARFLARTATHSVSRGTVS